MKKVLLIIIDALATRAVEAIVQAGDAPNFAKLIDAGMMHPECVAIFPSITPAATCALTTGCYPREHGVSGAYWYDTERDEVAYFGDDIWPILNKGVDAYLIDFERDLNEKRLQVPTLFEHLESHGRIRDAVINMFWFRGSVEHEVTLPPLFKLTGVNAVETLRGPHLMFMGDFVNTQLSRGQLINARGGIRRRFGFHDETTADYLLGLAQIDGLPEFTLAYFPNNDFDSHKKGPLGATDVLTAIDGHLGRLFEIHGGLDIMLEDFAILITGDHSQSDMDSDSDAGIDLKELLAEFQVVPAGEAWRSDDDIMVCPNMRAAQIYFREDSWRGRDKVVERLLSRRQIDQVIWCDTEDGLNEGRATHFTVATDDRGALQFAVSKRNSAMGFDDYGAGWTWSGDLAAVDARVGADGRLQFGNYPNAFERIAAAFFRQSGAIWVTARLGDEFCLPETSCHHGGSHGSLHALDSISPLIAAGLPPSVTIPERPRSVDITPLCMQILGLQPKRAPGVSHALPQRKDERD